MSYLPRTDAGLLGWSLNFEEQLSSLADPTTVGLTTQSVAQYTAAQSDYTAKYNAAISPPTRGDATILAKNDSKKALVALSRSFGMTIANFQGVTDQQRHAFGLTVPADPAPVPPPTDAPEMDIQKVKGRTVFIRLHNENTLARKKPDGVKGASIFSYVGETPPARIADWKFEKSITKTTTSIEFPTTVDPGAKVWLTAFWFNPTMDSGPACDPESAYLQFGGVSQAA